MNFSVSILAEQFAARMLGKTEKLHTAMVRVVTRLSITVQRGVKADKLSGQVLHVRTGTLRRSINREVIAAEDSVRAIVGTAVRYGRFWELGFDGTMNVRQHVRNTASGPVNVRAHTREVHVAPRSFLRSELNDQADLIRSNIKAAALEALRS